MNVNLPRAKMTPAQNRAYFKEAHRRATCVRRERMDWAENGYTHPRDLSYTTKDELPMHGPGSPTRHPLLSTPRI